MLQDFMQATFEGFVELERPRRRAIVLDHLYDLNPELVKSKKVGGVFCCDDADAIRVLGRLRQWGFHIADDISLISYGNTDLAAFFTPRITSIDSHCEVMAARTADIIKKHIRGEDVRFCQYVIQPDLVVRDT